MKNVLEYINEATANQKWIAVSVTTRAHDSWRSGKESTSERVVTVDTYRELKQGKSKGYMEVVSVEALGPECSSKVKAMEFLTPKNTTARKSKIKKGDADYIVWCIPSGKFTANGKTTWDWNLWEEQKDGELYFGRGCYGAVLFGAKGSLKEGDKLCCVDNDSQKKLSGAPDEVALVCDCNIEAFRKAYREKWPDKCKRPSRQFGKVSDGLPWSQFGQMYSIKGVAEEA